MKWYGKILEEKGRMQMSDRGEKAKELFTGGYNCAQSVVGAYADVINMDLETAVRFSEGLGAGMGRMRLTCGAVSAMSLVAGMLLGTGKPGDLDSRSKVYEKVQQMANEFKEQNGTVICSELLGGALPKGQSTRPEERTAEYYKKRPCAECVKQCAEIIEQFLGEEISHE